MIRVYGFLIGLISLPILFFIWCVMGFIFLLVPILLFLNPRKYLEISKNDVSVKGLF